MSTQEPRAEVTISVLMPVHHGVAPDHLAEALASVEAQTRPADQVVVVADGPLTQGLDAVLAGYDAATVVRCPEQRGAGPALAAGLAACTGTYVARADADDVNEPQRLARQVEVLEASGADVCATAMLEFRTAPARELGVRSTPLSHDDFARLARSRNPVNHPSVVFRRAAVEAAGGYADLPFLEDYDLWARMMAAGARFTGVATPLVRFRADGMHARRAGSQVDRSELVLQRRLVSYGLVSRPRAAWNVLLRSLYRRLPRPLLEQAYGRIFRQRS